MRRQLAAYLAAFLAGAAAMLGSVSILVMGMDWWAPSHLPPPAISNRISFDEKLRFLRQNPDIDPRILAIGSSITARHFDGGRFVGAELSPRQVLNGASWGQQINQTRFAAAFFTARFRSLKEVYALVAPADFENCTTTPTAFFNPNDAAGYSFEGGPLAWYYIKYFYVSGFLDHARSIADERRSMVGDHTGRLYMDQFGAMPLLMSSDDVARRGLVYRTAALDTACFDELRELARELTALGITFVVVINPVNPKFYGEISEGRRYVLAFVAEVRRSIAGSGAHLIDAHAMSDFQVRDFTDAYHLQWPAAQRLSQRVADRSRSFRMAQVPRVPRMEEWH